MTIKTYKDGTPFTGVIGRTTEESSPAWPEPPRPPDGAPNVLFFVLDDVGYGQLSCFGGLVETPVLDSVAANGLRYTNMHTTALCSPSRGLHPDRAQPPLDRLGIDHRDLHRVSRLQRHPALRQRHAQRDAAAAGLQYLLCRQMASDARLSIRPRPVPSTAGRSDAASSAIYGFLGGETNQWFPELTYDNHTVEPAQARQRRATT